MHPGHPAVASVGNALQRSCHCPPGVRTQRKDEKGLNERSKGERALGLRDLKQGEQSLPGRCRKCFMECSAFEPTSGVRSWVSRKQRGKKGILSWGNNGIEAGRSMELTQRRGRCLLAYLLLFPLLGDTSCPTPSDPTVQLGPSSMGLQGTTSKGDFILVSLQQGNEQK